MELFYDSRMESPGQRVNILGFGNDRFGNVIWTDPGMQVHGPTYVTFPEKYPLKNKNHEDGRSGPAHQSFPMGTICSAIPGSVYNFTIIARSNLDFGRIFLNVSCCDWSTRSQYSVLSDSESQVICDTIGHDYQTIHGLYTVPDDENAWFLQGILDFPDQTDYEISMFSVKRDSNYNKTTNFHVQLSGTWYNSTGVLDENEFFLYSVNPTFLSDENGMIRYKALIDGNKFGMLNLIFHEPILLCRNARFQINEYDTNFFNLSLTNTVSKCANKFKIIPFSNKKIYDFLNIRSDDNSGVRHISRNGNIWLTSNCPDIDYINVDISLNGGIINKPSSKCLYLFDKEIDTNT
jgi:hypothetical protein